MSAMIRTSMTSALIAALLLVAGVTSGFSQEAPGKIRNVLLIMADDLKASALPAYGDVVCKTPNLDRLAASGVVASRTIRWSSILDPTMAAPQV